MGPVQLAGLNLPPALIAAAIIAEARRRLKKVPGKIKDAAGKVRKNPIHITSGTLRMTQKYDPIMPLMMGKYFHGITLHRLAIRVKIIIVDVTPNQPLKTRLLNL